MSLPAGDHIETAEETLMLAGEEEPGSDGEVYLIEVAKVHALIAIAKLLNRRTLG